MTAARFPRDWLDPSAGEAATDLDLAVLLVNTLDLLEDEPDRLTDLTWLRSALRQVGHARLAGELRDRDLAGLQALRDDLRRVFECADPARLPRLVNALLEGAAAVPVLVRDPDGALRLAVAPTKRGLAALQSRLPAALSQHLSEHRTPRLGTCGSDPCRCAFVDRTRGGTRRYCCDWCNDRAAARAYRRRRKQT